MHCQPAVRMLRHVQYHIAVLVPPPLGRAEPRRSRATRLVAPNRPVQSNTRAHVRVSCRPSHSHSCHSMTTHHHLNKIAPVHMHSPSSATEMQQFTVGKLDAGMAILLGSRASLIEFPSLLLPQDVTAGSVVEISVKRNTEQERRNQRDFDDLQSNILDTFGRVGPIAPELKLRALTQTSVVLEWSHLELATSKLLSLDIYRNGVRLAPIPNPMHNTSTKLSGLQVGGEYAFHLVLKTTAGVLTSNTIKTRTHSMTDTSGISVCFGAIDGGAAMTSSDGDVDDEEAPISQLEAVTRDLLTQMGAKWSHKLQIDTTHYVCTSPRQRSTAANASRPINGGGEGAVYRKALSLNIPVVRPEWIVACHEAKRMVPISAYYIDQDPPNHASVQKLLNGGGERSQQTQQGGSSAADTAADSLTSAEGTSREVRARSETPPPPAPKDDPPPRGSPSSTEAVPVVEPPTTADDTVTTTETTAAAPAESSVIIKDDEATAATTTTTADETMEEIDLLSSGENAVVGASEFDSAAATAHGVDEQETSGHAAHEDENDTNAPHTPIPPIDEEKTPTPADFAKKNSEEEEAGEEVDLS